MQTGTIGVTTENIFPVIKKFLYSDHEIFLRELVSNAVDATQKLRTLASFGEYKGNTDNLNVTVSIDSNEGTLTISDHGIGMTAEDVDKYINQIAFSGAEEFLKKYKDTANTIIGHFGLGFYSAFMVAKKVEIRSLSYKDGAKAVKWSCDGSPEYSMEEIDKAERGTDIVLYIDDDNKQYLQQSEIDTLLKKYCRFLPVPVISGKIKEWKDGKQVDTDKDNVINITEPAWTKKPADLTDEDYLNFYHELYPGQDDPLFWIHLNVDYPFTLTGILYFPKIKNNIEVTKNRIQLYCNQVFVTDSVEGVVPEFMMLLQGVIDSPDIPLNVSRSYLQADSAVKKISGYITKKVSQRLEDIFKSSHKEFEQKWDDIKLFIEYGMLTDPKFCDASLKYTLLKDTEGQYFTPEEYRKLVEPTQTDADGTTIILYSTNKVDQHNFISAATAKGYNVLLMDGQLDSHFVGLLEQKMEKTSFVRVDSDVIDNLIRKTDKEGDDLSALERDILSTMFQSQIPKLQDANFIVNFEKLSADSLPAIVTQNEYMRRMKEMSALQPGMSFYGQLPDSYAININVAQPAVISIKNKAVAALKDRVEPLLTTLSETNASLEKLREEKSDNKKDEISALEKTAQSTREEMTKTISEYATTEPKVKQIIDLSLLANGLLKGAELSDFINRTAQLLTNEK